VGLLPGAWELTYLTALSVNHLMDITERSFTEKFLRQTFRGEVAYGNSSSHLEKTGANTFQSKTFVAELFDVGAVARLQAWKVEANETSSITLTSCLTSCFVKIIQQRGSSDPSQTLSIYRTSRLSAVQ
jgi:hypothetical protein